MCRLLALALLSVCLIPIPAWAQPNYGLRHVEIRQKDTPAKRVEVSYVDPKGLAQQMGLKKGDRLVRIGDREITGNADAIRAFEGISGDYRIQIERETGAYQGERSSQTIRLTGAIRRTPSGIYYHVRVP